MNESRVISQKSNNKHTSRVIKALQSVNLEDYNEKPQGVWGSIATIKCGYVTIKSDELDVEFEIPFDDNLESNEGEITIYNLSDKTIKLLKTKSKISIEAGYEGDTGVIFDGYITKASSVREETDKVTTIKIIDDIATKESLNLTFSNKPTAKTILKALLDKTGLPIAIFEVEKDHAYDNDVKIDEPIDSAIKHYSEVCGVSTFTSRGKLYCCKLSKVSTNTAFNVTEDTGMIGSPSPFEENITADENEYTLKGYDIEMLLQHRAAAGAVVNLKSEQYEGKYRIKSGTHSFSSESGCTTKIRVVE